jgi:hypothetical protein
LSLFVLLVSLSTLSTSYCDGEKGSGLAPLLLRVVLGMFVSSLFSDYPPLDEGVTVCPLDIPETFLDNKSSPQFEAQPEAVVDVPAPEDSVTTMFYIIFEPWDELCYLGEVILAVYSETFGPGLPAEGQAFFILMPATTSFVVYQWRCSRNGWSKVAVVLAWEIGAAVIIVGVPLLILLAGGVIK